jgi:hypothetical protein
MKFAYADPPYLGCGKRLYAPFHPDAADWDEPETHRQLIDRLSDEFEAWALSLHVPSLRVLLPMCPGDVRVVAWCKSFAAFKPNVNPAFAWEPVIIRGGRKRDRKARTIRDWVVEPITMLRGLLGAKPDRFCWWIFDLLGAEPGDDFHDLFPGSGAVGRAWDQYRRVKAGFPLFPVAEAPDGGLSP